MTLFIATLGKTGKLQEGQLSVFGANLFQGIFVWATTVILAVDVETRQFIFAS